MPVWIVTFHSKHAGKNLRAIVRAESESAAEDAVYREDERADYGGLCNEIHIISVVAWPDDSKIFYL